MATKLVSTKKEHLSVHIVLSEFTKFSKLSLHLIVFKHHTVLMHFHYHTLEKKKN